MHELRIGKLNSQLLQEIMKEGDEQRVARILGKNRLSCDLYVS